MRGGAALRVRRRLQQLAACAGAGLVCLAASDAATAQPAGPVPTVAAAPAGGLVAVIGDPGAVVFVDGLKLGTLPFGEPLRLQTGGHRLVASLGTRRVEAAVTVDARRPVLVRLSLAPPLALVLRPKVVAVCASVRLSLAARQAIRDAILAEQALPVLPAETASPDGAPGCDEPQWQAAGRAVGADYVLVLAQTGLQEPPALSVYDFVTGTQAAASASTEPVDAQAPSGTGLRELAQRVLALALDRPHGTLSVVTLPAGARIQVDGAARGVTPWTSLVHSGPHRVVAELPGHLAAAGEAKVDRDQAVRLMLTLSPRPVPLQVRRVRAARWALLALGLGGAALGATLWALDGRPSCGDPRAAELGRCPQELATSSAGIALVAGAAASLAVSAGLVGVERRLLRRDAGE